MGSPTDHYCFSGSPENITIAKPSEISLGNTVVNYKKYVTVLAGTASVAKE